MHRDRGRPPSKPGGPFDLFDPADPESADIGNSIVAAVSSALATLPAAGSYTDSLREFLSQEVAIALRERGTTDVDICGPRLDVLIPAIEALRYSQIQAAFATLIASSMDARTADTILPAYVEILKQLCQDELTILRAMPARGRLAPIGDIVYLLRNGQIISVYRNVIGSDLSKGCHAPQNIPQYVDNLIRLNLVQRPLRQEAPDAAYRELTKAGFAKRLLNQSPEGSRASLEKGLLGLSDLGESFRQACLPRDARRRARNRPY